MALEQTGPLSHVRRPLARVRRFRSADPQARL